MSSTITVRRDDVERIMAVAGSVKWTPDGDPELAAVWQRLAEASDPDGGDGKPESAEAPTYPSGEFSRVELPGYVSWVGWVTEETYAGAGVLVIRDISGTVKARVSAGAFRQVIPLALPKPGEGYDGQLALPAGEVPPADEYDGDYGGPF